jgi:hypothetical protein
MVMLDVAIVDVALPSIRTDLGFSRENVQWDRSHGLGDRRAHRRLGLTDDAGEHLRTLSGGQRQ